jgi:hypothetical protein
MVSVSNRSSPSSAVSANESLLPALTGNTMWLTITPPYLDPNSHEALYEIDVAALA